MSETRFTPGPWTADLHHTTESTGRTYGWLRGGNQLVPLAGITLGVEGMPQDEGRANARLIAAAPELYEALEAICSEFAQQHPLIAAGRAALAKARGENP